jgi:hypothetical protein
MPSKARQKKARTKETVAAKAPAAPARKPVDYYFWGMALIILAVSLIRIRLAGIPLERDEGEYAYMGRLILDGIAPYKEAYNMKLPGTYFMYALVMGLFGKTYTGIHVGLLLVNAATMAFLFLGLRRLFTPAIAFFAASVYGIMALSPSFLGFAAHATHFVSFFVSIALFFLAKYNGERRPYQAFLTGLLFGLAFLMKQQAVFFLVFGGLAIILLQVLDKPVNYLRMAKAVLLYSAGVLLPYALTVLILLMAGSFDKFWFWTVTYASKYASGLSFKDGRSVFAISFKPMWEDFPAFWLLGFAGFILVFFTNLSLKQKLIAFGFGVFAFLTVCPGFYFRQHYFISFLPAVGLSAAISLHFLATWLSKILRMRSLNFLFPAVLVLLFIVALSNKKEYYFQAEPEEIAKMYYGSNPFVESKEIARYIKDNSSPTDKIAVVGSEPQIYLYSDRRAATGYLYTYGLVENQAYNKKMQDEMIAEIEKAKPKFIVFVNVSFSWLYHEGAPKRIFEWTDSYTRANYELTGLVDQVSPFQSDYKWNEEAKTYQPKGKEFIMIYKRK